MNAVADGRKTEVTCFVQPVISSYPTTCGPNYISRSAEDSRRRSNVLTSGCRMSSGHRRWGVVEYDEIIEAIENAPLTQSGAIMIKAVEVAIRNRVFTDDEAIRRVVNRIIDRMDNSRHFF